MIYYSDGFTIYSNPSKFGGGYTIIDENNILIKREVIKRSWFSNNDGEFLGLLEACRLAEENDTIIVDSLLSTIN